MTLSFSQKWPKSLPKYMAGQNTLFPLKVIKSLESEYPGKMHAFKMKTFFNMGRFDGFSQEVYHCLTPKFHTIRTDKRSMWRKDREIHFVINNRTKERYQFAPIIPCTGTEEIFMSIHPGNGRMEVSVGEKYLYYPELTQLALNDGFNSFEEFEYYFAPQIPNEGRSFTIIHWTKIRYDDKSKV